MPKSKAPALQAYLFQHEAGILAEGPFWFENKLWWVDIELGRLHCIGTDGKARQTFQIGDRIGACVPIDRHYFVVALQHGIGIWCRKTGAITMVAAPESDKPDCRFNDGKGDPRGRFLAGTLNLKGKKKDAALYALDTDGTLRTLLAPVSLSNGLAWSRDGRTLYFIDTPTFAVRAFDYNLKTGLLKNGRVVVKIPRQAGYPDGMDIDKEGNLWIAHWDGWAVRCWSPSTGKCLAEVRLPCQRPTSCCFGGLRRDQLFITTARQGLTPAQLKKQPFAGSIFVCAPGTAGFPLHLCKIAARP